MKDPDGTALYAAVGHAISRWETLEAHLSFMYSIFKGKPLDTATITDYGRESKIFRDRITSLRKAAETYFQRGPNQVEEARAEGLIAEAVDLCVFRHRIAHGMLIGINLPNGTDEYRIVAPTHGVFHLTKAGGEYAYDIPAVDGYAAQFVELATRVRAFNHERHAPSQ